MTNKITSDDLATRMQKARHKSGMTIQEMADICGIPKSSLESYMRTTGAKQPGLNALVAIADGLDVSLDWLVGRSHVDRLYRVSKYDYALAFYASVVSMLRNRKIDTQNEDALHLAAAECMLDFSDSIETMHTRDRDDGDQRDAFARDLMGRAEKVMKEAQK